MPFTPQIARTAAVPPKNPLVSPSISTISGGGFAEQLNDVCYGQGKFVAVGEYETGVGAQIIVTSDDGKTWVDRSVGATNGNGKAVVYDPSGDQFVTIGWAEGDANTIWISSDGITWTGYAPSPSFGAAAMRALATDGNGRFVGCDVFGQVRYSDDMTGNPSSVVLSAGTGARNIDYIPELGRFFMTTSSPHFYSDDGENWTEVNVSLGLRRIQYHPGGFLLGTSGYVIYRSDDKGVTWTEIGRVPVNQPTDAFLIAEGYLVVPHASSTGAHYMSSDGANDTWTFPTPGVLNTWWNAGDTPLSTDIPLSSAWSPDDRRIVTVGYGATDVYVAYVDLSWNN